MKTQPTENLQKEGRTPDGRFAPGHTGNPKGRAPGSRNKATQAALALMEQITQTLVDAALGGDLTAIRLILERLVPPCKEKALPPISLPPVPDAQSLPKLTAAILGAVADGCITPGEGQALAALASTHAKNLELAELEQRIAALERTQGKGRP